MRIYSLENEIIFDSEKRVNAIHFEDKKLFATYIYNIQNVCNGSDYDGERISLTNEDMKPQEAIMIWDLFNINLNDKKIINAIVKYVQQELNNDMDCFKEVSNKYHYCVGEIERILSELPFEVEVKNEFYVADFVKSISLKVVDTSTSSLLDKVFKMIDIVSFTRCCELMVFVNLKTFFTDEELVEIYKYAVYNEVNILTLEQSLCESALEYEKVLLIDGDFEEFVLK